MGNEFWRDRRVVVGICGGIAAYKTCGLISSLAQQGAQVRVILTAAAEGFVTPLTVTSLARHPAYTDGRFWQPDQGRPLHIELGEWAEVMVIAPLTANTLAKLSYGMADDLLTNMVLASACPLLLAPAMNTQMWLSEPVQRNWQQLLSSDRVRSVDPTQGRLACDTVGPGRMAEPDQIEQALLAVVWTGGALDWRDRSVVISAGATREPIDRVRFISNPSSGRMGVALAAAAAYRGAQVLLIHGPLTIPLPPIPQIRSIQVEEARQMHQVLMEHLAWGDYLFMAAAVGDIRPRISYSTKLPKADLPPQIEMEQVPDILKDLSQHKGPTQKWIGFAAQVGDPIPRAQEKLHRKGLDGIVANPIDLPDSGFDSEWNQGTLITARGDQQPLPRGRKIELAHQILDWALHKV